MKPTSLTSLTTLTIATAVALPAGNALGDIIVTQSAAPAPTYSGHSITFDEPGVPVGVLVHPFDFYQPTDGVTFNAGNSQMAALDWDGTSGIAGGAGTGNQLAGGLNIQMFFDGPVTEISWQGWADGAAAPPFGGINIIARLDGVDVASYVGMAPFGGVGDEWFNIVATGGDSFDEIRFYNSAFSSTFSYIDNMSWNAVPTPGALALLGVAGVCGVRRRRTDD